MGKLVRAFISMHGTLFQSNLVDGDARKCRRGTTPLL